MGYVAVGRDRILTESPVTAVMAGSATKQHRRQCFRHKLIEGANVCGLFGAGSAWLQSSDISGTTGVRAESHLLLVHSVRPLALGCSRKPERNSHA